MKLLTLLLLLPAIACAENLVTDLDGNVYDADKHESYRIQYASKHNTLPPNYFNSLEWARIQESVAPSTAGAIVPQYSPFDQQLPYDVPELLQVNPYNEYGNPIGNAHYELIRAINRNTRVTR